MREERIMKKLITLAFLLTLVAGVVEARSIQLPKVLGAKLLQINIDPTSPIGNLNIRFGQVTVDQVKRNIKLDLQYGPVCRPGFMCPRVIFNKRIELPITRSFRDTRCGIITYVASKNLMPVDGMNQSITVVDYSNNRCVMPMHLPYMETSVKYDTAHYNRIEGKLVTTKSSFTAEALEELPRPLHTEE